MVGGGVLAGDGPSAVSAVTGGGVPGGQVARAVYRSGCHFYASG